jgi:hypothetical protein
MPPSTAAGLADLDDLMAAVGTVHLVKRRPLFGCPAVWHDGGKPFMSLWGDDIVFRLAGADLEAALALPDAALFEPMPGRRMGGWVRVPRTASRHWPDLAQQAAATPLSH